MKLRFFSIVGCEFKQFNLHLTLKSFKLKLKNAIYLAYL